jgi:acyl-CoA synthetase (AMP-forming)/AMP-acid ligase II
LARLQRSRWTNDLHTRIATMTRPAPTSYEQVFTLGDLARFNGVVRANKEALLFERRSTSYGEFDNLSNQVANGLIQEGIKFGTRVAFMGKTSDLFFQLVFGCAKSGTVLVGINWRLTHPEVAYILRDSKAEILFVGPEFWTLAERVRAELPTLKRIIAMGSGHPQWQRFEDWRDRYSDGASDVEVTKDDVAIQMYTSGTTGHPKGVQLAHQSFFAFRSHPPAPDMDFEQWTEDDVSLVAMPSYHIGGVGWGIAGMRAGSHNIVIREFDPGIVLDIIQKFKITKLFLVPAAMRMVLQHPNALHTNFDSLKYITYAASPIPLGLLREALQVFKCGFVQLYGMTETTGGATYLPPGDHDVAGNERMRSAGKAFPGVDIKVVDLDGREVPPRKMGEICIRSPANMIGYWNLPDTTAQTLIDGYVHSGDIGYLDEDGYVYVLDRAKDMIVSGAENVSPAEVENVLSMHPAVAEVAVIGVPDKRWGEAVKAIVVVKHGQTLTAVELITFARQSLAGFKVPKSVDFAAELPRNPTGKVLKRELRRPFWANDDSNVT